MIKTSQILTEFLETRQTTEELCAPLKIEDYVVQPTEDVSPPKWHLGHTTWFLEEFILKNHKPDYKIFNEDFAYIFNSYYESFGERVVRTNRGNLSRPTVEEVYTYRDYVTQQLTEFIEGYITNEVFNILEIGIHHEKQHQELLITDIKYILGNNPLQPSYSETFQENFIVQKSQEWITIPEGIYNIGHATNDFCYDNELGNHKVYLHEYKISDALVTNGQYLKFINDGGYKNFKYWHSDGWEWVQKNKINAPFYWHNINNEWFLYTLNGLTPLNKKYPVTHISFYEAYAFAQWKGYRLPTEFEWEVAQEYFIWGQRWEWTESAYVPYPKYKKAEGALGEYNGKFMVNQKVLRGGSVATPKNHTRHTYRNFFHPGAQWQFTGIRLAE